MSGKRHEEPAVSVVGVIMKRGREYAAVRCANANCARSVVFAEVSVSLGNELAALGSQTIECPLCQSRADYQPRQFFLLLCR